MKTRQDRRHRAGAALVEFAFVASVFFLLLFGIMEYARLCFTRQVIVNASREGARYIVANIADATVVADTTALVKTKMCGLDAQTSLYTCQIYMSDSTGANIGAATNAGFGQYICVQIDYDYVPLLPTFLSMSSKIRITSKDMMFSEAN